MGGQEKGRCLQRLAAEKSARSTPAGAGIAEGLPEAQFAKTEVLVRISIRAIFYWDILMSGPDLSTHRR